MNKLFLVFSYLLLLLPLGISGQKLATELIQLPSNSEDFSRLEITDTLEIELTIQAGASYDSSASIGSCFGASSYDIEIYPADSISYQTNTVTISDYGMSIAYYTISSSLLADTGTYILQVIYSLNLGIEVCRTRLLLFTIHIIPAITPIADFKASPNEVIEGGTVHFTDLSSNVITDWFWDFGDGENSNLSQPTHIYRKTGKYSVTLKVTGPGGADSMVLKDYINVVPKGSVGVQIWEFQTDKSLTSSPAIGDDGIIYIGASNHLYAVNPEGTEKWRQSTIKDIRSVTIGSNENIYYSTSYILYAADKEGNILWSYPTGLISPGVAVGVDSNIYILTDRKDSSLIAINQKGRKIWSYNTGNNGEVSKGVSIAQDGTIYVAGHTPLDYHDKVLYAINPDGNLKWIRGYAPTTNVVIDNNGTIYFHSYNTFYAINPDGSKKWEHRLDRGQFEGEPTIGPSGNIYVIHNYPNDFITSFSSKGDINWTYQIPGQIDNTSYYTPYNSSVTIGSDTLLYCTARDTNLYVLNSDGTLNWKYKFKDYFHNSEMIAPTINRDSILFAGLGNRFFALTVTSRGLANSPWPKAGQNIKNTRRQINPPPNLVSPKNDSVQLSDTLTLYWISIPGATKYELEMSNKKDFSGSNVYRFELPDTSKFIDNLQLSSNYYWHVRVTTTEGLSNWSTTWRFSTFLELPPRPILITPSEADSIPSDICTFIWEPSSRSASYQLQIAEDSVFKDIHTDTTTVDTSISIVGLDPGVNLYWRARGINISGAGEWSEFRTFEMLQVTSNHFEKTSHHSIFELEQNYPNPFKSITNIKYALPKTEHVTLIVYNITGQEVAILVEGIKQAGSYEVQFDGHNLQGGTYYYTISSSEYQSTKKCVLLK